jgi:aminoglycoside phosphotransferase
MWEVVSTGKSAAIVSRSKGVYRKQTPEAELEASTLKWLGDHGMPVPDVLDVGADWLITAELRGTPGIANLPPERRHRAIDALAEMTTALHDLAISDCPWDRSVDTVVREAVERAHHGLIDLDDLDTSRSGWTAQQLIEALLAEAPRASARETAVVTHGDLTLANVIIDPDTAHVVGMIDTARLGKADRCADLGLMARSLRDHESLNAADRYLRRSGWDPEDDGPLAFYRLMDEFF